jgi:hypothetical protein
VEEEGRDDQLSISDFVDDDAAENDAEAEAGESRSADRT